MSAMALLDALLSCEHAVWEALVSGDAEADGRALAADFLGVYPDGFAGRAAHLAQLAAGPTVVSYTLNEERVLPLGADHALLAYRAEYVRARGDAVEAMYVSSVWRRRDGGWENVFSQDTPATGRAVP